MTIARIVPPGKQDFFDSNGDPLVGGSVYMYIAATTTFKNTWQDEEMSILNTNPIILDSAGRAIIFGTGQYRQRVFDALGNEIWDRLTRVCDCATILWAGTSTGTPNAHILTLENGDLPLVGGLPEPGTVILWMAGQSNTAAMTIEVHWGANTDGPRDLVKYTALGPIAMIGGEIVTGNVNAIVWDDESAAWHSLNYVPVGVEYFGVAYSIFTPAAGHECVVTLDRGAILPEDAVGSVAYADTLATLAVAVDVQKNEVSIGTIDFSTISKVGVFTVAAEQTFIATDRLTLVFPGSADATFASIGITLRLTKVG